ncbi:hypothetical protein CTAM01_12774, partial [Colletotrichum tamarilloi]
INISTNDGLSGCAFGETPILLFLFLLLGSYPRYLFQLKAWQKMPISRAHGVPRIGRSTKRMFRMPREAKDIGPEEDGQHMLI